MPRDTTHEDQADGDDDARAPYRPPSSAQKDRVAWLALKIAGAMSLAHLAAVSIGFVQPTWTVIVAGYLAMQPPEGSLSSAGRRAWATAAGLALGIAGAWLHQFVPTGAVAVTFLVIGAVGAALAVRDATYMFAAVVATIITLTAQTGNETILVEALRAALMIAIGCVVGPAVVWAVERVRAWRHGRRLAADR